jgi:hypothetical protein
MANLTELERKLLAAARRAPLREETPYAFEQRVMRRLLTAEVQEVWSQGIRVLWQSAGASLAIAACLGAWLIAFPFPEGAGGSLADALDQEVYAELAAGFESW